MKRKIYLGTGLLGLGLAGTGLLTKRKLAKRIKEEEFEQEEAEKDLIIQEKIKEEINKVTKECNELISKLANDNEELKNEVDKLRDFISKEEKIKSQEQMRFESIKDELENYLDDTKIPLYDLRCSAVFNENMEDRNDSINKIIIKFIDIYEKMLNDVRNVSKIKEYSNEFRESIDNMNKSLKEVIEKEIENMKNNKELEELIECVDNILLDILEIKGKFAMEEDNNKRNKILKKAKAKIRYARNVIDESNNLKNNEIVQNMILKLAEEEQFIEKLVKAKEGK